MSPRCDLAEPPVVCVAAHEQHANTEAGAAVAPALETTDGSRVSDEARNKPAAVQDSTIRVNVTLLDRLMNLVGELVLARNQIAPDTCGGAPSPRS